MFDSDDFIPADQTKIRSNAGIAANMTKFLFDMVINSRYKFDEDKDKSAEDC
jgi:hypothetical protein